MKSAHLFVLSPGQEPRAVPLRANATKIGSGAQCDVRLADSEVEALHAEVRITPMGAVLERHASPLIVNGRRIKTHMLAQADLVLLGRSALVFRTTDAPEVDRGAGARAVETSTRLYQLVRRMSLEESPAALTEHMLDDLVALAEADRAILLLLEDGSFRATASRSHGSFDSTEESFSRTVMTKILSERKPLTWHPESGDPDLRDAPSLLGGTMRAVACAPILSGDVLLGALYLSRAADRVFRQDELDLLGLYAAQAALLVATAERAQRMTMRAADAERTLRSIVNPRIIGSSAALQGLMATLGKLARTDLSVLILGETGVGKEVFARELHLESARAAGAFVAVNCGAIPEPLIESELFGHVRGAFTDARQGRPGLLRSADGGTLFLDEIGEMPLHQQIKLLRVLEERRVTPVGGEESYPVDFRLVCATNRALDKQVEAGRFRSDLYFRVAGITLDLPPLREREDDAVELAEHFLVEARVSMQRPALRFSAAALAAIRQHAWPGNVRELQAAVRKAVVLEETDTVEPEALGIPRATLRAPGTRSLAEVRDEYLKAYVEKMVAQLGGNRTAAAEALQVSVRTIFKYLNEL